MKSTIESNGIKIKIMKADSISKGNTFMVSMIIDAIESRANDFVND